MNTRLIIQLVTAATGTIGFGLIFHLRKKYMISAAVGGFLGWFVYLLTKPDLPGVFLPALSAGLVVAFYAEIMARLYKAPSTPFFIASSMPMIPGSFLYYCIRAIGEGNRISAIHNGVDAFLFAIGIATGMGVAWSLCDFSRKIKKIAAGHSWKHSP